MSRLEGSLVVVLGMLLAGGAAAGSRTIEVARVEAPAVHAAALEGCATRILTAPGHWTVEAPQSAPVTVALRYAAADVPAGVREDALVVWRFDAATGSWAPLSTAVDILAHVARAEHDGTPAELVLGAAVLAPPCAPQNLRRADALPADSEPGRAR